MSTAGITKVSVACLVFDGTDYPYWKNKMHMHLEAIDINLSYVINTGFPKVGEGSDPTQNRTSLCVAVPSQIKFKFEFKLFGNIFLLTFLECHVYSSHTLAQVFVRHSFEIISFANLNPNSNKLKCL